MPDIDIHHISEMDFESVCKEFVAKHPGCRYCPADWNWEAYPDVGFASITNDKGMYITWGHHNYRHNPDGTQITEDILCVSSPTNGMGDEKIINTKKELLELICKSFGITDKMMLNSENFNVAGLNSPITWELCMECCPESYNVWYAGKLIADIRERNNHITVCPIVNHKTDTSVYLYEAIGNNLKSHATQINTILLKYIKARKHK